MSTSRLFVAVWPTAAVRRDLERLCGGDRTGLRWEPARRWHITLRFLGQADPEEVRAAMTAIRAPRPEVTLGPRTERLGGGALVLPARGLDDLAAAVRHATAACGGSSDRRRFVGHLTVARGARRALDEAAGVPYRRSFRPADLTVVESRPGPAGPDYEVVGKFPFRPSRDA